MFISTVFTFWGLCLIWFRSATECIINVGGMRRLESIGTVTVSVCSILSRIMIILFTVLVYKNQRIIITSSATKLLKMLAVQILTYIIPSLVVIYLLVGLPVHVEMVENKQLRVDENWAPSIATRNCWLMIESSCQAIRYLAWMQCNLSTESFLRFPQHSAVYQNCPLSIYKII